MPKLTKTLGNTMRGTDLVNIIFGMKVRQARQEAGLSLSAFAKQSGLSPSYVTEIEKGRKHPKSDKILRMAQVLNKRYDDLVSIQLDPSLAYLEQVLASPLLAQFPFEEFGLEATDLLALLTRIPDKTSALLHALLEIGQQHNVTDEHFLRGILRSYQQIHDNYFPELEAAADNFMRDYQLTDIPLDLDVLKRLAIEKFGFALDCNTLANYNQLSSYRSVFVHSDPPKLLLNSNLSTEQIKFLLLREMGYQYLNIKDRANTSAPDKVHYSFQQVLNDFRTSYFAGAVMIPQAQLLDDLETFFHLPTWQPAYLLGMLDRYGINPDMLFYRFSEVVPQFFGLKLYFMRVHRHHNSYRIVRQLNITPHLFPEGIYLREHYCRRWLTIRLLKSLPQTEPTDLMNGLLVRAQLSERLASQKRYLNIGFARQLALSPTVSSSVSVGFKVGANTKNIVRFVDDPALAVVTTHDTCERCPLTPEQCTVRAVPPVIYEESARKSARTDALANLLATLQD